MTKRHNRKFGISRSIGQSLWGSAKDPVHKRNTPPGQHGTMGYKKLTDYGVEVRAKRKLKKYYGDITEKQFRKVYNEAVRRKGDTSENMIGLLESRLDAMVYRAGFTRTIFAARQFVNHGHVLVDGKRVNIPSFMVKVGQVVSIREKSRTLEIVVTALGSNDRPVPDYLELDNHNYCVKYLRMPILSDVPYPVVMEPEKIIEHYSK